MHNWSINIKTLKTNHQKYEKWRLEQLINFGLGNKKLNKNVLKKNLPKLSIDPHRRNFLEFLLYEGNHSNPKTNAVSRTHR